VSLARAVYADADVYILDDVLSAVDSHVGKHIFEECITGALKHKARVFITHQNHFLPYADRIVIIKEGQVVQEGTYQELVSQGVDFASLAEKKDDDDESEEAASSESPVGETDEAGTAELPLPPRKTSKSAKMLRTLSSIDPGEKVKEAKLIESEERETGVVNAGIYWAYIMACGGACMLFWLLFSYVFAELVRVGGDMWLSLWSTPAETRPIPFDPPPFGADVELFFLYVYILLGLGYAVFSLWRNLLTAWAGVTASKNLHGGLFENILKAPVSFFDITPVGRILNRFTKDLDNVDNLLPQTANQFLGTLFICISTLVLIVYITPIFLAALIPISTMPSSPPTPSPDTLTSHFFSFLFFSSFFLVLCYIFVMQYYRRTSRELQRLDSVSRSPIYSSFGETLSGVDTIRAYNLGDKFCAENETRINYNMRAYWMVQVTNRWLSLRLEVLGTLITFSASIFAVVAKDVISPSLAGLSITYALQVTGFLNWVVRMATQGEAQMNAVERIKHYSLTPNEADWIVPSNRPAPSWPNNPSIVMVLAPVLLLTGERNSKK